MNDLQTKSERLKGLINLRTLKVKCECGKQNTQGRYCPFGFCKGVGFLENEEGELENCLCNPKVGLEEYE